MKAFSMHGWIDHTRHSHKTSPVALPAARHLSQSTKGRETFFVQTRQRLDGSSKTTPAPVEHASTPKIFCMQRAADRLTASRGRRRKQDFKAKCKNETVLAIKQRRQGQKTPFAVFKTTFLITLLS